MGMLSTKHLFFLYTSITIVISSSVGSITILTYSSFEAVHLVFESYYCLFLANVTAGRILFTLSFSMVFRIKNSFII